jgi:hypothetical protein
VTATDPATAQPTTAQPTTTAAGAVDWVEANQRYTSAALDLLRARLAGDETEPAIRRLDEARRAMPRPPALEAIATAFGLSDFERDTLLMCAGVELDGAVARACAQAQGDPVRGYASFALAMTRLPDPHWSAVTPVAPLRRWHLVELGRPEEPANCPLRVDERLLHALAGIAYLDPRIESLSRPLPAPRPLPPALDESARWLATQWSRAAQWSPAGQRGAHLHGRATADLCAVATAASAALGLRPICLRATDLPASAADRELLARLCERETALDGWAWLVELDDTATGNATSDAAADAGRRALDLTERLRAPVVLVAREPLPGSQSRLAMRPVSAPRTSDTRAMWRDALGPSAARLDGWLDRVAGQFDLDLAGVDAAVEEVRTLAAAGGPDGGAAVVHDGALLWDACRRQARPALDDLTARVEPRATWDDLVVPAPQRRILHQVVAHVRHRVAVLDDWGFAARTGRGLGTAVLFAGPSGTGKTLAAEVLAGALALDLYRVDLSQVVNKYIGETEKNLRRIFDAAEAGGAVLLFDEADALFGKRSEVKDSHDRYANIEVSYLLQRMETYRGLAILTTNLKTSLDTAFLRRLRFIVHFPFPDAAGRAEIWRRMFPAQAPTDGLDPVKLARLMVPGGTIRNIALSAAFLAADLGEPVGMAHVLEAARTEYLKLDKPMTDTEVAGWTR